jgi:hypothetical protein
MFRIKQIIKLAFTSFLVSFSIKKIRKLASKAVDMMKLVDMLGLESSG